MKTISQTDGRYVADVLNKLQSNPTSQDLDFLIEAHARVGYLEAIALGIAEQRVAERKYEQAKVWAKSKSEDPKRTAAHIDALVMVATYESIQEEIEARTKARKISNLKNSIEQKVNGVKYLGRNAGEWRLPNVR